MSDHKEHISHYTAADIQRYVQGKLSAREMHAMEKAALDDPFLADAIEGYQQAFSEHEESLVSGQLQQLQQHFNTNKASTGKVVAFKPFRYWQAAAAAVVVIITGVWIYSLLTNSDKAHELAVAKNEEVRPQQHPAAPTLQEGKAAADSTTTNGNATSGQSENARLSETASPSKPRPDDVANKKAGNSGKVYRDSEVAPSAAKQEVAPPPEQVYEMIRQQTDSVKPQNNWQAPPANGKDVAAAKKEAAPTAAAAPESLMKARSADDARFAQRERETELITIAKTDKYNKKAAVADNNKNNLSGFIKGQVTDHKNNPIANAYLQIPNNNNNFYTDKTGFFKIPVSDSVVDVAVNVTGYGTQNFRLQNNAGMNNLQLQPANVALNEVEVKAIKVKKQAASNNKYPNVMVYDAEPVFGWVAFDQYLEKNKKIPTGASAITGNVLVSFQVNKKGELADFRIEQPLSKSYDEEAIRLIMQGPSWKLLKGRKARVTVMVRF